MNLGESNASHSNRFMVPMRGRKAVEASHELKVTFIGYQILMHFLFKGRGQFQIEIGSCNWAETKLKPKKTALSLFPPRGYSIF